MPERDIAAEVLKGLQEVREHQAGKRTLREWRVEATPLSELAPEVVERIRQNFEDPAAAVPEFGPVLADHQSAPDGIGQNRELSVED